MKLKSWNYAGKFRMWKDLGYSSRSAYRRANRKVRYKFFLPNSGWVRNRKK